ncbi:cellulosome anchor protein, partial [Clostridium perfringens]
IEIAVNTSNVSDLYGASIDFVYDSSLIEVQSINKGSIWGTGTNVKEPVKTIKNGQANLAITFTGNTQGISGNGTIAIIKAKVLKSGTVNLKTTNLNDSLSLSGFTSRVKLADSEATKIDYVCT